MTTGTSELGPQILREIAEAEARIRPHIRQTPLEPSAAFAAEDGALLLKCENLQHTGSFKVRGALNKVLSLAPDERARGVVTASTGNHGAAVAFALAKLGAEGTVFLPENAAPTKIAAIRRLGAAIAFQGLDGGETEAYARRHAEERGLLYLPPYSDPQVIGGQGTIAIELLRQHGPLDAVFVGLGGGGLIAGIAAWLKAHSPHTSVIGCSPAASQVMIQSVRAGRILDLPSEPTLSDGTAGGVEAGAMTLPLVQRHVDAFETAEETEIAATLRDIIDSHHMLVEGAAAMTLACYRKQRDRWRGKSVAVVLCGANIGLDTLRAVLNDG